MADNSWQESGWTAEPSPMRELTSTQAIQISSPAGGISFEGARAYDLVAEQLQFGSRELGSRGHELVGEWILERGLGLGWAPEEQKFPYMGYELRNLILKNASLQGDLIILGTHYDTRPVADRDAQFPLKPVPGANDGASGVAVLLELARIMRPDALDCMLWLVFFDAEDAGGVNGMEWIAGSSYFVKHMEVVPAAAVIVDMVGDADLQLYIESNSDQELAREIWEAGARLNKPAFMPNAKYSILDDHTPFIRQGIPAVDIIDFEYPYWHTTQDTLDKISAESLAQVGEVLQEWLWGHCH